MVNKNVKKFSLVNSMEGYSYIALLFIAMPLKYMMGIAVAVKIAGMVHGLLFIAFLALLLQTSQEVKWPFKESVVFFIASLVPFGTFYTKNKINAYA